MYCDYEYRWLSKLFVESGWLPEHQGVIIAIFQFFRDQVLTSQFPNLRAPLGMPRKLHTFRDSRIPVSHSRN